MPKESFYNSILWHFLFFINYFSVLSSHPVDMPFKVAAVYQFCKYKLFKNRDGTGKKRRFLVKQLYSILRQYHIPYSE